MEVPMSLGDTAALWDEQNIDLTSAASQVGDASTAGFSDGVTGAASSFASRWRSLLDDLAAQAESQADSLRQALADYLDVDLAQEQQFLPPELQEWR
jgi:hypothetical protein